MGYVRSRPETSNPLDRGSRGIDASLVQEGYRREFRLLKRGMAGTPQAQQARNGDDRYMATEKENFLGGPNRW